MATSLGEGKLGIQNSAKKLSYFTSCQCGGVGYIYIYTYIYAYIYIYIYI